MLENLFTTKMSTSKKKLQERFSKIRFKGGKWSKLAAVIILCAVIGAVAAASIYFAVIKNEYAMSEVDFIAYTNRSIGAVMANIDYADDEKVVFDYLDGFFITNEKTKEIKHRIDLSKLNIAPNGQGDTVLDIVIDKEGKYAYLSSRGAEADIKKFDKYIINLDTGRVKKGEMPKGTEVFGNYILADKINSAEGWSSIRGVAHNNRVYYLNFPFGTVGNIQLIKKADGADEAEEIRYIFGEKYTSTSAKREKLIYDSLAEGEEIISGSGVSWSIDAPKAREVVRMIGRAATTKDVKLADGDYEIFIYSVARDDGAEPRIFMLLNKESGIQLALSGDLDNESFRKIINYLEEIDKEFEMSDLEDMQDITLVIGANRFSSSPQSLTEIEEILSSAKPLGNGKGSGCPFQATLIILNKNKEKTKIDLATDTCAVFKSGDTYYDYRDRGSEELYGLFGLNRQQLYKLTRNAINTKGNL